MHYNNGGGGGMHGQQHQQQYNNMGRGRGGRHNATGGGNPERRELRRPHQQHPAQQQQMNPEDLARGMQHMDPFGNSYPGYAQPAPNADGWSSGENSYEQQQHHHQQQQQQQHYMQQDMSQQQQQYHGHHQQQPQQQQQHYQPRHHNNQYRPRNQYHHHQQQQQQQYNQYNQQQHFNPRAHTFVPNPMSNRPSAPGALSAAAAEFVPGGSGGFGGGAASAPQPGGFPGGTLPGAGGFSWQTVTPESASNMTMDQALKEAVTTLSQNADLIDDVEKGVITIYKAKCDSDAETTKFVDATIAKCLKDVSFRGPGAQLLGRLNNGVGNAFMHKIVLQRAEELNKSHMEAKDTEDLLCHAKLRTFALFTADLYLSLKIAPKGGQTEGVKKEDLVRDFRLGLGLMDLLTEMGQRNKDKENYKAISQAMKLAGSALDADEKIASDGATPKLDALMTMIETLGTDEKNTSVSKYIKEMMTDIVALRKGGWGTKQIKIPAQYLNQENNSSSAEATAAIPQHHLPYGGMAPHEVPADYDYDAFNGSNGDGSFEADDNALTEEELAFMNEQMAAGAGGNGRGAGPGPQDDVPSEPASDAEGGGMNAEMEAAFEQFMLDQQKST